MDKETQDLLLMLKEDIEKATKRRNVIQEYLNIGISIFTLLCVIAIGIRKVDQIDDNTKALPEKLDRTTFSVYGDYVNDRFETIHDNFVELGGDTKIREIKEIKVDKIMSPTRGGTQ